MWQNEWFQKVSIPIPWMAFWNSEARARGRRFFES